MKTTIGIFKPIVLFCLVNIGSVSSAPLDLIEREERAFIAISEQKLTGIKNGKDAAPRPDVDRQLIFALGCYGKWFGSEGIFAALRSRFALDDKEKTNELFVGAVDAIIKRWGRSASMTVLAKFDRFTEIEKPNAIALFEAVENAGKWVTLKDDPVFLRASKTWLGHGAHHLPIEKFEDAGKRLSCGNWE